MKLLIALLVGVLLLLVPPWGLSWATYCQIITGASILLVLNVSGFLASVLYFGPSARSLPRRSIFARKPPIPLKVLFADLPPEVQHHILELSTCNSPNTFMALQLSSRWMNQVTLSARCLRRIPVCLTNDAKLLSFSEFLKSQPHKTKDVTHLLMSCQCVYSRSSLFFKAISIINRCPNIASLGCNIDVLMLLTPAKCISLTWLSLDGPIPRYEIFKRQDTSGELLALFGRIQHLCIACPPRLFAAFPMPLFTGIQSLVYEEDHITHGFPQDEQLEHALAPYRSLKRTAFITYYRTLGSVRLAGSHSSDFSVSRLSLSDVDCWRCLFVRCMEDEDYVWKAGKIRR